MNSCQGYSVMYIVCAHTMERACYAVSPASSLITVGCLFFSASRSTNGFAVVLEPALYLGVSVMRGLVRGGICYR